MISILDSFEPSTLTTEVIETEKNPAMPINKCCGTSAEKHVETLLQNEKVSSDSKDSLGHFQLLYHLDCSDVDSVDQNNIEEEDVTGNDSDNCDDFFDADDCCDVSDISETDEEKEPLYPGCNVTLGAFMLLIALFCTKHNIVGEGIQQLLDMLALILPSEHKLVTTLHSYKTFFKNLKHPLKKHYYCKHCLFPVENIDSKFCSNSDCGKSFELSTANYFLEMPVINQIRNLFAQHGFYENLAHRFNRKIDFGHYFDIYDGQLYKSYSENNGPLSKQENISFVGNTDGAAVFKSRNISVWPIFLVVNELPYKIRMKKENMILAALWFGSKKPVMSTFFKPLLSSLRELANGITCYSPSIGNFISKAYLMCFTADLPARSLICNCNPYNIEFSCWKCLQKGSTAKSGKGYTHIFRFNEDDPKGPKRTKESVFNDASVAVNQKLSGKSKAVCNGIKGPSWLILFPEFNIIDGVAIDYMHGVLLGVQKLLLRLWFAPEFSKEPFSFNKCVNKVDESLKKIQPTLDITRLPRSIQKDLKYWKASEYRSFLLFYGAVVLFNILDNERFSHYLLLVHAMQILLKSGSSDADISYSEELLFTFCQNFDKFYHERFMTLNIHQLLHLPDSVRQLGPLYTHSCFSFEDKNGVILKMIRGTQNIDNQITTGISFVQKLPELKQNCILLNTREEKICESIENPHLLKRTSKLDEDIYALGSFKDRSLSTEEFLAICEFLKETPASHTFCTFNRIELRGILIYGTSYKRMLRRDNSVISFCGAGVKGLNFGQVHFFICLSLPQKLTVAIIHELQCTKYNCKNSILKVKTTKKLKAVNLNNIRSGCLFIAAGNEEGFVCQFPNRKESD